MGTFPPSSGEKDETLRVLSKVLGNVPQDWPSAQDTIGRWQTSEEGRHSGRKKLGHRDRPLEGALDPLFLSHAFQMPRRGQFLCPTLIPSERRRGGMTSLRKVHCRLRGKLGYSWVSGEDTTGEGRGHRSGTSASFSWALLGWSGGGLDQKRREPSAGHTVGQNNFFQKEASSII